MTWASDFFRHGNNKVKKKASPFANHVKAGRNENCATVILFDYEVEIRWKETTMKERNQPPFQFHYDTIVKVTKGNVFWLRSWV